MNTELEQLIADYLDARAARDKTDQDIRYLETEIRQRVAAGQTAELPGRPGQGIKVLPPIRRFDPEMAEQILTIDQVAMISAPTISRSKAERLLPPVLYDQCKRVSGQPSVRVL